VLIKNKLLKMTSLDEQILVVEKDIVELKIKIETVEKAADDCTDLEEKKQLRDKEKQLREKETQLREKELILLNAKHHPTGINILDG
jgi:predicted  nucleic acid-binding Zn-ribbon protein